MKPMQVLFKVQSVFWFLLVLLEVHLLGTTFAPFVWCVSFANSSPAAVSRGVLFCLTRLGLGPFSFLIYFIALGEHTLVLQGRRAWR